MGNQLAIQILIDELEEIGPHTSFDDLLKRVILNRAEKLKEIEKQKDDVLKEILQIAKGSPELPYIAKLIENVLK